MSILKTFPPQSPGLEPPFSSIDTVAKVKPMGAQACRSCQAIMISSSEDIHEAPMTSLSTLQLPSYVILEPFKLKRVESCFARSWAL